MRTVLSLTFFTFQINTFELHLYCHKSINRNLFNSIVKLLPFLHKKAQCNLFFKFHFSDNMQHAYWELKREMSNLHLVTQVQAELLRKLKTSAAVKKGKSLLAANADSSQTAWRAAGCLISVSSDDADKPFCSSVPAHTHALPWLQSVAGQPHMEGVAGGFSSVLFFSPCGFSQPSVAYVRPWC